MLLHDGEQVADLVPVLNWLILDNWIGVTATTGRVYLYLDARRALGETVGRAF